MQSPLSAGAQLGDGISRSGQGYRNWTIADARRPVSDDVIHYSDRYWKKNDAEVVREDVVTYEVATGDLDHGWWRAYRAELEQRFDQQELVLRRSEIERLWIEWRQPDVDMPSDVPSNSPHKYKHPKGALSGTDT
jgi:hypothetical protein